MACCTKEKCYQDKLTGFKAQAMRQFEEQMARNDAEDLAIARAVSAGIADGLTAKRIGWALLILGASYLLVVDQHADQHAEGFKWDPATMVQVRTLLGQKGP